MRYLFPAAIVLVLTLTSCHSEMARKGKLVDTVNRKVSKIDQSHRMQIIENDFIKGDSIFKIRGYYSEKQLMKMVGILKTPHFERDDYFYFENDKQLFSGHMMNFRDDNLAEEFKYYFDNGEIARTLMWEDHYQPGERFPHETFEHFEPNLDSLINEEKRRLEFFKKMLEKDGIEIQSERENLGANN